MTGVGKIDVPKGEVDFIIAVRPFAGIDSAMSSSHRTRARHSYAALPKLTPPARTHHSPRTHHTSA